MTRFERLRRSVALDSLIDTVCACCDAENGATLDGPAAARRKAGRPAKLGEADTAAIQASREPIPVLMERYSVSRSTITRARRVKTPAATSEL